MPVPAYRHDFTMSPLVTAPERWKFSDGMKTSKKSLPLPSGRRMATSLVAGAECNRNARVAAPRDGSGAA